MTDQEGPIPNSNWSRDGCRTLQKPLGPGCTHRCIGFYSRLTFFINGIKTEDQAKNERRGHVTLDRGGTLWSPGWISGRLEMAESRGEVN